MSCCDIPYTIGRPRFHMHLSQHHFGRQLNAIVNTPYLLRFDSAVFLHCFYITSHTCLPHLLDALKAMLLHGLLKAMVNRQLDRLVEQISPGGTSGTTTTGIDPDFEASLARLTSATKVAGGHNCAVLCVVGPAHARALLLFLSSSCPSSLSPSPPPSLTLARAPLLPMHTSLHLFCPLHTHTHTFLHLFCALCMQAAHLDCVFSFLPLWYIHTLCAIVADELTASSCSEPIARADPRHDFRCCMGHVSSWWMSCRTQIAGHAPAPHSRIACRWVAHPARPKFMY